jgi:hypothetical protein
MAKLTKQLMIYDPVARAERGRTVTIEGSELLLDCFDRETSRRCADTVMIDARLAGRANTAPMAAGKKTPASGYFSGALVAAYARTGRENTGPWCRS